MSEAALTDSTAPICSVSSNDSDQFSPPLPAFFLGHAAFKFGPEARGLEKQLETAWMPSSDPPSETN